LTQKFVTVVVKLTEQDQPLSIEIYLKLVNHLERAVEFPQPQLKLSDATAHTITRE